MTVPRGVTVLDGGLSNALEDLGHDLADELWTARLLRDDPDEVRAVHAAYFAAGADVATTASYQASDPDLLRRSVEVARRARDEAQEETDRRLLVAASLGPYGALLADGSEYRGRYGVTAARLRDVHAPRLEVLAAAGPDLVAVETVPDLDEAEVIAALLPEVGLPAWFSYAVADGRTRAGQPLDEAFAVLAAVEALVAVGVNCSDAGEVPGALRAAGAATGKPGVAYPNRGEAWDSAHHQWVGPGTFDPAVDGAGVDGWLEAGATWVGGCCRVGPDDIAALVARVRRA